MRLIEYLFEEHSAGFWFLLLLIGTVVAVSLMLVWLLLLNRWHERTTRHEAEVREKFGFYFSLWMFRDPLASEARRIGRLSSRDHPIFMALCVENVTSVCGEFKERVGVALRQSGLFGREIKRLAQRQWWIRREACWNLGRLGMPDAVPHLIRRLADPHATVRISAIIALSTLRATEAVIPIIGSLERFNGWSDMRASMALQKMGPGVVPHLEPLLDGELSPVTLKTVLQVIGHLGIVRKTAQVQRLVFHPSPEVRVDAVRALSRSEADDESVKICISALKDQEWPVRAIAAQSLGTLGDRRAIPDLETAMSDSQYWVRHHAAEALSRLGDEGARSLEKQATSEDRFVREMAEQMLFMQQQLAVS